jgi:peptidoglycan hydrolase-like protein with peptidoglycan-binding domain
MKRTLKEDLERIHSLTYGEVKSKVITEWIFDTDKKEEDPKKADEVSDNVKDLFDTLEKESNGSGISEQEVGSIDYKKSVESLQIGLVLLGYELPRYGVDGLFGPETASAVESFMNDNGLEVEESDFTTATPEMIGILSDQLKNKDITEEDLKDLVNQGVNVEGLMDQNFYEKLLENLDAPISNENLKFLYAWRQSEGKAGKFNPFNTTHGMPGATDYNSVGVKNYRSLEDGMVATIKTLKNGRYNCIIQGLRDDIGASNIAKCKSLETWGTGDLVYRVIQGYEGGASPKIKKLA